MALRHGLGLIPDDPDPRDLPIGALVETDAPAPDSDSVAFQCHPVLDQETTESCVLFAAAQSLWIVQGSLGVTTRFLLSPLAGYHDARRLRGGRDCTLVDLGCSPRFAWEALRTLGPVSWEDWPFVAANVNAEVPWNARRNAIDRDWLAYFRIEEEGDARCHAIKRAINQGYAPSIGLTVDQGLVDWAGPDPWRRTGPVIGRHMVTVTGYDPSGVHIVNSWGYGWGIAGHGLLSWDTIRSEETTDLTVPQIDLARFKCLLSC